MNQTLWMITLAGLTWIGLAGCNRSALNRKPSVPDPLLRSAAVGEGREALGVRASRKPQVRYIANEE